MIDLTNHKAGVVEDDRIVFYDGMLYIIEHINEDEIKTTFVCINPEYDEPMTLNQIKEEYPKVSKVIYEDAFNGAVYNCGNHESGEWECIGHLVGYA